MQDNRAAQRYYEPDMIDIRRNPYPKEYEERRGVRSARRDMPAGYGEQGTVRMGSGQRGEGMRRGASVQRGEGMRRSASVQRGGEGMRRDASVQRGEGMRRDMPVQRGGEGMRRDMPVQRSSQGVRRVPAGQAYRSDVVQPIAGYAGRPSSGQRPVQGTGREVQTIGGTSGRPVSRQSREAMLRERQRRRVRRQRMAVGLWAVCILAIGGLLLLNRNHASAAGPDNKAQAAPDQKENQPSRPETPTAMVQGLPVEKYTAHPEWKEDFLTPNEYSRPGEPLTEVKDVFVHYTANPGTSAAQNRSYFEQQKDVHMASVSSHFIIGYEGEIIQCVPLDEIAYAVAGRNYDSISIECCFTAQDGSFTQETYDSLISLLAWLTDVYDLDTDHILRHYDCGGKKCPIYYTEHEDKWEKLKRDVKEY